MTYIPAIYLPVIDITYVILWLTGINQHALDDKYIRYDILFYALVPGTDEHIKLIINVEAQKGIPGYPLLKRANVYTGNMVSRQKGTEYENSDYSNVKKCYSIWICMESPNDRTSVNKYHFTEKHIIGQYNANPKDYDIQNIVTIYLGKNSLKNDLINLLEDLFKSHMNSSELRAKLKDEYGINLNPNQEGDVNIMCNLSEGVYERGMEAGRQAGMEAGMQAGMQAGRQAGIEDGKIQVVIEMLKDHESLEKIARYTQYTIEHICNIKKEYGIV